MSAAKQVQIIQGTPQWHEWRRGKIGGSDSPAILGESPYKTKRDLFFEKSGLGEPDDEDRSYIFRRGHEAEAELRALFSKHTKLEINPTCFEKGEIFGASLDGYDKSIGILEAKLVGREVLKKASGGEIPEHHRIQIQHQLYTSDSDKAFWGGKAPKVAGGVVVEIGRDEGLIKRIIQEVKTFWEMVQSGDVPDLTADDTLFLIDPAQVKLAQELKVLKWKKDLLEKQYEEIEKQVKGFSTHARVKCDELLIIESERAGSIDYAKIPEIKALSHEYLESFRKKPSKYKSIRFGKVE